MSAETYDYAIPRLQKIILSIFRPKQKLQPNQNPRTKDEIKRMVKCVKPFLKTECLDVGCLFGEITKELNKLIPTIGLDISEERLEFAKKKNPGVKFRLGSVTDISFPDNEFDTIFAGELIEHVSDTRKMFSEFRRVLRKDGHLILIVPEHTFLKNLFITFFLWESHYFPLCTHTRYYSRSSLNSILSMFGFRMIFYKKDRTWFRIISKTMLVVAKNCNKEELK